jgi:hypothetical protein
MNEQLIKETLGWGFILWFPGVIQAENKKWFVSTLHPARNFLDTYCNSF